MKRDNKGLTIVELIVAIAILAIAGIAITNFMTVGTRSFFDSRTETDLQKEAQLAMNLIEDHLVDANKRVYSANEDELVIENDERDGSVTSKKISCDKENKQLYYSDNVEASEPEILAEYVEEFKVTTISTNNVDLEITFKNNEREYIATKNVTLRNPVGVSYNGIIPGEEGDVPAIIKSVLVSPKTAIVTPGSSVIFMAVVRGSGVINQAVTWKVEGDGVGITDSSINDSGFLTIGANEKAVKLKITATSVEDPTKSGSATVSVKKVKRIVVTSNKSKIEQNMTFALKATVEGTNITSSAADQAVSWAIVEGSQYVTQVGVDTFRVSAVAPVGTKVTITATSVLDSSVEPGKFSFNVLKSSGIGGEDGGGDADTDAFTEWPEEIKRGGSGTFKVKKQAGQSVSFKVTVTDKSNGKLLKEDTAYTYTTTGDSCKVNILKTLGYEKEATVKVTATFSATATAKASTRSATAPVKKVALKFGNDKTSIKNSNITGLSIYYLQNKKKSFYYELEGIESVSIDWKGANYDRKKLGINFDKDEKKVILSVPSLDVKETTVRGEAFIGSYDLKSYIEATVAGGNLFYVLDAWTQNPKTIYTYLPLPDTDEFKSTYGTADNAVWLNSYNDVLYTSDYCDKKLLPNNESDYFYYGIQEETYWDGELGKTVTTKYWYFAIKVEMNYYLQPVAGYKCPIEGGTKWVKWF